MGRDDDARIVVVMKVNELKVAMDAQFAEMKAQFAEADQRFAQVDQRFERIDQRFERIDQRFEQVDQRFAQVDDRFDKVDERLDTMDARITSEGIATRRHFDVVVEDVKSDIRLLASAVAANTTALERHITTSLSERKTVSAALDDHEVRLTVLERHRS